LEGRLIKGELIFSQANFHFFQGVSGLNVFQGGENFFWHRLFSKGFWQGPLKILFFFLCYEKKKVPTPNRILSFPGIFSPKFSRESDKFLSSVNFFMAGQKKGAGPEEREF